MQCNGITKKAKRCKNTQKYDEYCYLHQIVNIPLRCPRNLEINLADIVNSYIPKCNKKQCKLIGTYAKAISSRKYTFYCEVNYCLINLCLNKRSHNLNYCIIHQLAYSCHYIKKIGSRCLNIMVRGERYCKKHIANGENNEIENYKNLHSELNIQCLVPFCENITCGINNILCIVHTMQFKVY
jgi:hypothetical protein